MTSFLVFGPHPDDQELGMGGTIAKLVRQGHKVHLVDMTTGEPTPHGSEATRLVESAKAAAILGVARTPLNLKNREVVHNIEARHKAAAIIRVHRPTVLFVPFPIDAHPDHVAVTRICEDARFDAKLTKSTIPGEPWHPKRILYYYCTHLRMNFAPTFCFDISDTVDVKQQAMEAYQSQFGHNEVPAMVRAQSAYFGSRIGCAHAEPFFSHEAMGFNGLDQLV